MNKLRRIIIIIKLTIFLDDRCSLEQVDVFVNQFSCLLVLVGVGSMKFGRKRGRNSLKIAEQDLLSLRPSPRNSNFAVVSLILTFGIYFSVNEG